MAIVYTNPPFDKPPIYTYAEPILTRGLSNIGTIFPLSALMDGLVWGDFPGIWTNSENDITTIWTEVVGAEG